MLNQKDFSYFSTYLIGIEAESRGIKVNRIFKKGPLSKGSMLEMSYKGHTEVIVGQRTSQTDCIAYWIQHNKHLAKHFFKKAGISIAEGEVFDYRETDDILKLCHKIKYPVVIKPLMGIQGKKVFIGVDSDAKVRRILKEFKKGRFKKVVVEKEHKGEEYRIFATRDKFVAATWRIPANVTGDGLHNVEELIRIKNKDPRRGDGHSKSLVKIKIDEVVKSYLKQQRKTLKYKPKEGERVYLRPNSNLSTGGDSVDITDKINPEVKKLAVKVIRAIPGLAYAGIDYLTEDVTKRPTKKNYIIIEVNDSPMLSMHHVPYEGESRDAAGAIIDQLYPETKKKRVKRKK